MRTGDCFLCVYSINHRNSFEEITTFYQQILRVKDRDYFPCILVANKCDLESERVVSVEEGKRLARDFGCKFIETSAKKRIHVDDAFYGLVREVSLVFQILYETVIEGNGVADGCLLLWLDTKVQSRVGQQSTAATATAARKG